LSVSKTKLKVEAHWRVILPTLLSITLLLLAVAGVVEPTQAQEKAAVVQVACVQQ